jgi:hypothetical protein
MNLLRNKKVIIVLVIFLLLVITSLVIGNKNKTANTPATQIDKGQKVDTASGETISDPPGKDVDNYGTNTDAPLVLGTSNFIDEGLSLAQEDGLKWALYSYFGGQSKGTKQISIIADSILLVPYDPNSNSTVGTVNFRITVNDKDTYKVTLNYFDDQESIQIVIKNTLDEQLHDSGMVTDKSLDDKI